MKIYIPNVGTHLELTHPWTVDIEHTWDNVAMLKFLNIPFQYYIDGTIPVTQFTVSSGAVLKIEQVYIRKGSAERSSLKFLWRNPPAPKSIRFQALLKDVNAMECQELVKP